VSTQEAQNRTGAEQGSTGPGEPQSSAVPTGGMGGEAGQPSEAELRAAYEAELSRITSADMVLQATVSLLNIGARRLGLVGGPDPATPQQGDPERDLEQVRDAIDAVRGLMPVVERRAPQEARPLRDALSQLQMAYARESQGAPAPTPPPAQAPPQAAPTPPQPQPDAAKSGPGPAESSGRLWVPGR
jgi:hypothetical protein